MLYLVGIELQTVKGSKQVPGIGRPVSVHDLVVLDTDLCQTVGKDGRIIFGIDVVLLRRPTKHYRIDRSPVLSHLNLPQIIRGD